MSERVKRDVVFTLAVINRCYIIRISLFTQIYYGNITRVNMVRDRELNIQQRAVGSSLVRESVKTLT